MTELNGCDPIKIKVAGPYKFSIGNPTGFNDYVIGGVVTE
jgi:ubiquitin-activating enzyme E1